MDGYLPPVVTRLIADLSDFVAGLAQSKALMAAWAKDIHADTTSSMRNLGRDAGMGFGDQFNASLDKDFRKPLTQVFDQADGVVKNFLRTLGQIGSGLGGFVTGHPILILILTLIPLVIALSAALAKLLGIVGLIPSAFGFLLAALIPLVVAFQGFGAAIAAVMSGDLDEMGETFKKLSPAARDVVREIAALIPHFKTLKTIVQEAFFVELKGAFPQLLKMIPDLTTGMAGVAGAFGRVARVLVEFLGKAENVKLINTIFAGTAKIIDGLAGPFGRFLDGFLKVAAVAMPIFVRVMDAVHKGLGNFGDFMSEQADNGQLDLFIESAITTAKELWALIKSIGGLFGTMFDATEGSGHEFIKTLTQAFIDLDAYLKTPAGKDFLMEMVFLVKVLGATVMATVQVFMVLQFMFSTTLHAFAALGGVLVTTGVSIVNFFKGLPAAIWGWFVGLEKRVRDWFNNAYNVLYSSGRNLISGLVEGMKSMATDAVNAAKGVMNSIKNGVKGILGIQSPSTVFAELGRYSMQGYLLGLQQASGASAEVWRGLARPGGAGGAAALSAGLNAPPPILQGGVTHAILRLDGRDVLEVLIPHAQNRKLVNGQTGLA